MKRPGRLALILVAFVAVLMAVVLAVPNSEVIAERLGFSEPRIPPVNLYQGPIWAANIPEQRKIGLDEAKTCKEPIVLFPGYLPAGAKLVMLFKYGSKTEGGAVYVIQRYEVGDKLFSIAAGHNDYSVYADGWVPHPVLWMDLDGLTEWVG